MRMPHVPNLEIKENVYELTSVIAPCGIYITRGKQYNVARTCNILTAKGADVYTALIYAPYCVIQLGFTLVPILAVSDALPVDNLQRYTANYFIQNIHYLTCITSI